MPSTAGRPSGPCATPLASAAGTLQGQAALGRRQQLALCPCQGDASELRLPGEGKIKACSASRANFRRVVQGKNTVKTGANQKSASVHGGEKSPLLLNWEESRKHCHLLQEGIAEFRKTLEGWVFCWLGFFSLAWEHPFLVQRKQLHLTELKIICNRGQ